MEHQEKQFSESRGIEPDEFDKKIRELLSAAPHNDGEEKTKKRKWLLLAAVIAAVLLVIAGMSRLIGGASGADIPVTTAALAKGNVQERLSVNGPVSGTNAAEVMSNLHAEVTAVLVKEGDHVEAGQPLASLDTHDVGQDVKAAENQLSLAQANRDTAREQAEAGYEKARQALKAAQDDYTRKQTLAAAGDISQAEFEQAEQALANAQADIGTYRVKGGKPQADESFDLQVAAAQLALEKARDNYAKTTVTAPISGTVTRVSTKVGQFADMLSNNSTASLFTIEDLSTLELDIRISEYSIGKVRVGQPVEISADIMNGKTAEGEVMSVSLSGEPKDGTTSERVIPTKVRVTTSDSGLISGITAKADILLDEAQDVWVVPLSALVTQPDGSTALAFVKDGVVTLSPLETGVESDIETEVRPLNADDPNFAAGSRYIVTPDASIVNGVKVTDTADKGNAAAGDAAANADDAESAAGEQTEQTGSTESAANASGAESAAAGSSSVGAAE